MKRNPVLLRAAIALVVLGSASCRHHEQTDDDKIATEVAVQVGKVTRANLRGYVEAYGTVEPELAGGGKPGGAARLAAPAAGVVLSVPVKEGQQIDAGTVVVRLDDRFAGAMAEKARHALEFAEQQSERQKKLAAVDGTSQKSIQETAQLLAAARAELAAAQAQLAQVQLASPLKGVVARINVQPGQTVEPNTIVAEILDPSRLVVTVNVPADEAAQLKNMQPAQIFIARADEPAAAGTISFISPEVDTRTGAVFVRLTIPPATGLRSGQFVRARIVTEERDDCLAVPQESVVKADDAQVIYVISGDKAVQHPVKVGLRDGKLVEVAGTGFKEGDTVVTLGSYGLPKETKVRILKP